MTMVVMLVTKADMAFISVEGEDKVEELSFIYPTAHSYFTTPSSFLYVLYSFGSESFVLPCLPTMLLSLHTSLPFYSPLFHFTGLAFS